MDNDILQLSVVKKLSACTHKHHNSGIGVIIFEANLVQIGLIIADIFLFMKCDLDLLSRSADVTLFVNSNSINLVKDRLRSTE